MGDVLCTIKVMPDGADVDIEELKKNIQEAIQPEAIEVQDLAFGLKEVIVKKILSDQSGGTDETEQKLGSLPNVQSVEVIEVNLV